MRLHAVENGSVDQQADDHAASATASPTRCSWSLTASARALGVHYAQLLSDNRSNYASCDFAKWLEGAGMYHVRTPGHLLTQGKIERGIRHEGPHSVRQLSLPGDFEAHMSYHESLRNLKTMRHPIRPWPKPPCFNVERINTKRSDGHDCGAKANAS